VEELLLSGIEYTVHKVSNARQLEIHTAEPVVPDPSPFEVEIAITKLKMYKLPVVIEFWQN
jgi:hypothetical protein